MSRTIQREFVTKNQHCIEHLWKHYVPQLRKRLGRAPQELVAAHKVSFYDGFTAGLAVIVKATQVSNNPDAISQWITDIAYELELAREAMNGTHS